MEKEYKNSIIKSRVSWAFAILLAVVATMAAVLPFIFMVFNSFKGKFEMLTKGVFAPPEKLNLTNYEEVLGGGFVKYFGNSVFVLCVSLLLVLFISACAAYPLARFKFRMNGFIYAVIVACMAIPIHITLIPVFQMTKSLKIYDTIWAMIGPNVAFACRFLFLF